MDISPHHRRVVLVAPGGHHVIEKEILGVLDAALGLFVRPANGPLSAADGRRAAVRRLFFKHNGS